MLFGSDSNQNGRVLVVSVLMLLAIAGVDYLTGVEARVYPLYYLPIALSSWRVSRRVGLLFASLSTVLWFLAMSVAGPNWTPALYALNTTTQLISFVMISLLVSTIAIRLARERELSQTDGLTGLRNARAFRETGEFVVSSSQRSGRTFTLAYLDLDNFKQLNDKLGHEVGDQALICVANILKEQTRKSDLVARLGGDEFVLLLPETPDPAATALLDGISSVIASDMAKRGWPVTASIGAFVFSLPPDSLSLAIEKADAVMYRAKRAGRNRVVVEVE